MDILPARADQPLPERLEAVAAAWRGICAPLGIAPAACQGIGLSYPSVIDTAQARILDHFGKYGDASKFVRIWAATAVNLIHAYDPERLIFGGGIMGSGEMILPFIRDYVTRHAHTACGEVRVVPSQLGDQAALVACEWLVTEQILKGDSSDPIELR
jgi:glucokinase